MINNVVLVGRLTKDIELRKTQTNKLTTSFSLAVEDTYNKEHTDFISCVAWNQSAEYLNNYAHKGDRIGIEGKISTRSYDGKNGKVYVTEVVCSSVFILQQVGKNNVQEKVEQENKDLRWEELTKNCDEHFDNVEISTDSLPFY